MKPLIALIAAALLTSGCGAAAVNGGAASSTPSSPGDVAVSHNVDPNQPAPAPGGATLVTPVHGDSAGSPVFPAGLRVGIGDDGHAWARVTWWGGVPTCYVLRPVKISRHGTTIRLRLLEGSNVPADTACIDIAMKKAVRVDLGALDPGSYTVRAGTLKRALLVGS
jgi:hypothetical protein